MVFWTDDVEYWLDGWVTALDGRSASADLLWRVEYHDRTGRDRDRLEDQFDSYMMKPRTVLMTGGHVTPAVALAQALRRLDPSVRLVYLGRPFASERMEVERVGMDFIPFISGKVHRYPTVRQLLEVPKFVIGFSRAWRLLGMMEPRVVIGFGGYLSVPVVVVAKLLKIPAILHEQTVVWGAANRFLKKFAKLLAVSWPNLVEPGVVLTGNPIPEEIQAVRLTSDRVREKKPVLLILGGSQGSRTIDEAVSPLLPGLINRFDVYHQTRRDRPLMTSPRYHSAPWFSTPELAEILAETSLVIARSGANTVTDLAYLGVPAILVPLPIAGSDEQQQNAKVLARTGLVTVIAQASLTPETLRSAVDHMESIDHREAGEKAHALVIPDAALLLAKLVMKLVRP